MKYPSTKGERLPIKLQEKRDELVFALSFQGWDNVEIAQMFNLNRSTVGSILRKMPEGYRPKWVKAGT